MKPRLSLHSHNIAVLGQCSDVECYAPKRSKENRYRSDYQGVASAKNEEGVPKGAPSL